MGSSSLDCKSCNFFKFSLYKDSFERSCVDTVIGLLVTDTNTHAFVYILDDGFGHMSVIIRQVRC